MERALQPIYCLADSQLLFWREEGCAEPWLASLRDGLAGAVGEGRLRAAYVGASNGDEPAFYSIFQAAVEAVGVEDHRMILSSFQGEDREFLASADLVVLSGGDPVRGWRIFEQSGLQEAITRRYFEGAVLLGVSAGAVQLGWAAAPEEAPNGAGSEIGAGGVAFTFRLVPAVVGVHEEDRDWEGLRRLLGASGAAVRGLGIPSGGGLAYHPDGVIEPIRLPVHELVVEEGRLRHSLLLPGRDSPAEPAELEAAAAAEPAI
jgi:hypothetical protein